MPVKKRTPKLRRPVFDGETLELFCKLEGLPQSSQAFKNGSRELAHRLGLTSEWWTCNHVNDRSRAPCGTPGGVAIADWHVCRAMRRALLKAASDSSKDVAAPRDGLAKETAEGKRTV